MALAAWLKIESATRARTDAGALRASQAVYVKLLLVQVKAGRQASQKFDPAFGPKSDEARKCGQLTAWFRRHSGFVRSAAFSPDG